MQLDNDNVVLFPLWCIDYYRNILHLFHVLFFVHMVLFKYGAAVKCGLTKLISCNSQANAASGMAVHDECKLKFLELKTKRTYRSIVFKIEEKQKQVIVEATGDPAQTYEAFTDSLPTDECRYAVFDFDFLTPEGVPKSRIFFIAW